MPAAAPPHSQVGSCEEDFLAGVYQALTAASAACQLVSLSHPEVARQMQRVTAHLMQALRLIACSEAAAATLNE